MLRYIGVICIFIFTFYVVFVYERYQKRSLLQGEEFLLFLKMLLDELQGMGRSPAECVRSFRAPALEKTAFLRELSQGNPPHAAYRSARDALCLPHGMDRVLDETFENFGRGARREECRRISDAAMRAEALLETERQEHTRRLTLCRTLATASAMGLVILLM